MTTDKSILVLHGITMSGASMLRTLRPLGQRLEALGFNLIAPDAAHRMPQDEIESLLRWMESTYGKVGQRARDWFRESRFWNAGEHYDWFQSTTDATTGQKTYGAVERSLDRIAEAMVDRDVSGVLGFSQGAAMAIVVAARALQGDARFTTLRWGIFASGFKPVFAEPKILTYPASGRFSALFVIGGRDPLFPAGEKQLYAMSEAFDGASCEHLVIPELGHDIPTSERAVERIAEFAKSAT